jgi:DNA (cytosine-5)-methyltransferase 1
MLVGRGAAVVIGDLAKMGYDCQWCIVSASDCGAPHQRDRFWLVGYTNDYGQVTAEVSGGIAQGSDSSKTWQEQTCELEGSGEQHEAMADTGHERVYERWLPDEIGESLRFMGGNVRNGVSSIEETQDTALADTTSQRQQGQRQSWFSCDPAEKREGETDQSWTERVGHIWGVKSPVGRVADGVAARVDRLKAIGNGQIPCVAATAFRILSK